MTSSWHINNIKVKPPPEYIETDNLHNLDYIIGKKISQAIEKRIKISVEELNVPAAFFLNIEHHRYLDKFTNEEYGIDKRILRQKFTLRISVRNNLAIWERVYLFFWRLNKR